MKVILKIVFMVAGLIVLAAGIIIANDQSGAGGTDGTTSWLCEEPTGDPEATEGQIMTCETNEGQGVVAPAVPITISLLGLGLVIAAVAIGQTGQRKESASTAQPTPGQFPPPQTYHPSQAYPGRPPQGPSQPPHPPAQPSAQAQPSPQVPPRGDEPSSG